MPLDPSQSQALHRARLHALVRTQFGHEPDTLTAGDFPGGAMLGSDTDTYVLLTDNALAGCGAALARTSPEQTLHLLAESADAALLSRISSGLDPAPIVWEINGTTLAEATPATIHADLAIPPASPLVEVLHEVGCEVIVDGDAVIGEILGLEVARIGVDERTGEPALRVGVGAYDQEAFATINPDMAAGDGLRAVVDEIRSFRRADAAPHPANRLVRERWIRSILIADPGQIGLRRLAPVAGVEPRVGLKESAPAGALGTDADGDVVLVVCSTGVDFSVIPVAAEAAVRFRADRVVVVVPERDQYPALLRAVTRLKPPSSIHTAPVPWETSPT